MDKARSMVGPDMGVVFYTMSYRKRLIYWYLMVALHIIALIVFLPLLLRDFSFLPFYLMWVCLGLYNSMYFYRLYRITRLIISDSGIRYYGLKYQLNTSWEDLGLARNRTIFLPFLSVRLISKNPHIKRNLWFDWDLDTLWGKARYFIPFNSLNWDGYNELVGLIKQHRPDLGLEI